MTPTSALRAICAFAFVGLAVAYFPDGCSPYLTNMGPGLAALRSDFDSVTYPSTTVAVDMPLKVQRGGPVGYTQHLLDVRPPQQVLASLEQELPRKGWRQEGRRTSQRHETTITFCRGETNLSVTAYPRGTSTSMYVAVLWTDDRNNPSYCPRLSGGRSNDEK